MFEDTKGVIRNCKLRNMNPNKKKVLNEERTRLWIQHTEHTHGHFRHRYAIHIWSDEFNLTTRNPWFSSFFVSSKSLSKYHGNHDRNHRVWNIASTERYIFHLPVLLECCYISVLHNTSYCTKWSAVIVLLHLTYQVFFVYLDWFLRIVCCCFFSNSKVPELIH